MLVVGGPVMASDYNVYVMIEKDYMHKLLVILLSIIITVLQLNIFSFSSFEEYLLAVTLMH